MDVQLQLAQTATLVNNRIGEFLPEPFGGAEKLLMAMRYSASGGKRVRAFITLPL